MSLPWNTLIESLWHSFMPRGLFQMNNRRQRQKRKKRFWQTDEWTNTQTNWECHCFCCACTFGGRYHVFHYHKCTHLWIIGVVLRYFQTIFKIEFLACTFANIKERCLKWLMLTFAWTFRMCLRFFRETLHRSFDFKLMELHVSSISRYQFA